MLLFFIHWAIFCITSDKIGLWDGLMAPSLEMTTDQTGMSSSEGKFICASQSLIFFICFVIWINFHHKPGRAGRQPTELQSFSFMAGWEKEGGQWFQHASVDYHYDPIPLKSNSHFTHPLFSSGQNSRIVPRGRWKLHGIQKERAWWEEALRL